MNATILSVLYKRRDHRKLIAHEANTEECFAVMTHALGDKGWSDTPKQRQILTALLKAHGVAAVTFVQED